MVISYLMKTGWNNILRIFNMRSVSSTVKHVPLSTLSVLHQTSNPPCACLLFLCFRQKSAKEYTHSPCDITHVFQMGSTSKCHTHTPRGMSYNFHSNIRGKHWGCSRTVNKHHKMQLDAGFKHNVFCWISRNENIINFHVYFIKCFICGAFICHVQAHQLSHKARQTIIFPINNILIIVHCSLTAFMVNAWTVGIQGCFVWVCMLRTSSHVWKQPHHSSFIHSSSSAYYRLRVQVVLETIPAVPGLFPTFKHSNDLQTDAFIILYYY